MSARVNLKVIDTRDGSAQAEQAIADLRRQLSPQGDVISPRGRQLTEEVFGEALSPQQVVERICEDVRSRGLEAALHYGKVLDKADLSADTLRVSADELADAHAKADPAYLQALRVSRDNVLKYQQTILHRDVSMEDETQSLRYIHRPLRRVGACVPGGAAAYPSTLIMTVVPAQAAGVKEIAVVAPPTAYGANNPDVLAACHELGVTEVYRLGGAQGIASLAYGLENLPAVDKIAGPGNLFVALAKQYVSTNVGIDMMAGPTEVVVLADSSANPAYVAADLIAQAEHAPGASILITWDADLAQKVNDSVNEQLDSLSRAEEARESLIAYGAILITKDEASGCALSNAIAPEHLAVETADPEATLAQIQNAGAVFMGDHTPVAVGDFIAGPSHTLPTGGSARFADGLSCNDFLTRMAVIKYSSTRLAQVADDLRVIAAKEGLTAHSHSVDIRLQ